MADPLGSGNNPRRNPYEKPGPCGPLDNDHWRCNCYECKKLSELRAKANRPNAAMTESEQRAYNLGRVDELRFAADSITDPRWLFRVYSMSRKAIARGLRERASGIERFDT